MRMKVLDVKALHLTVIRMPYTVLITAYGTVPTGGWSAPQLNGYVYLVPPTDGIYSFDFTAKRPEGPASDVLTPIVGTYLWGNHPTDLRGVRVRASGNEMVAMLKSAAVVEY